MSALREHCVNSCRAAENRSGHLHTIFRDFLLEVDSSSRAATIVDCGRMKWLE